MLKRKKHIFAKHKLELQKLFKYYSNIELILVKEIVLCLVIVT